MIIYLKLVLTAIFWGGTFVAARTVSGHIGPFTGSFVRFAAASLLLAAIAMLKKGRLPRLRRHQAVPAILLGMTGVFAYNIFFFSGLQTITAGRASLIVAMNPVLISLLSDLFFNEKLHSAKIAGAFLCFSGVILVISRGNPLSLLAGGIGRGELFLIGCVVSWVAYSLIVKAIMKDLAPFAAVLYSCAIGTARASVFINLVPVSGVFLGWLLLGEPVNLSIVAGAALVMGGVYLTNMPRLKSLTS